VAFRLSVLLPLAAACAALVSAATAAEAGSSDAFHAARSVPEKVLDEIIRRSDKDDNLFYYILQRPGYDATKDSGYSRLFTRRLLQTWANAEAELVKQDCGGKYVDGEICGFDYSPHQLWTGFQRRWPSLPNKRRRRRCRRRCLSPGGTRFICRRSALSVDKRRSRLETRWRRLS
jgi:hypothetical protein